MSAGHHSNNGDKRNGFALVRKRSSVVEKAAPRAKRIVSGMVADTLALANQSKAPKPRGKLLIVDDQCEVRDLLRVIFKDEYDLLIAEDGPTAIELAKQHDVDVVITNINMAGMSGIELLERLKLLKSDIEVIVLSGLADTRFVREALQLGACDYINKPCEIATIRSAVSKAMQRRSEEILLQKHNTIEKSVETQPQPVKKVPRIVVIDENTFPVEFMELAIKRWFKVELKTFLDRSEGLNEISWQNPDLLIIELVSGDKLNLDTLQKLADRKVTYPIVVTCGLEAELTVKAFASKGLNITFLLKPFTSETLLGILEAKLKILRDST